MDLIHYLRTQWDRVGGVVAVILGAVLVFIGWQGVQDTAYPAEQIPYLISGGLGGLLLIGVGAILWISADLRDEWRRIESLEHTIERHAALLESTSDAPAPAPDPKPVRRVEGQPARGAPRVSTPPVIARSPWSANEVIVVVVLEAGAAVMTGAAWYVSSITHDPVDQIPWLVLGIAGTVVGAMAAMMFLLEGRRAVGSRFWEAANRIELAPVGLVSAPSPDTGSRSADALVAVAGTRRFHRADCILVAGKPTSEATAGRHHQDGRDACPVCLPA